MNVSHLEPNNKEDKADHTSTGSEKVSGHLHKLFVAAKDIFMGLPEYRRLPSLLVLYLVLVMEMWARLHW